jgi:hypothetical protein
MPGRGTGDLKVKPAMENDLQQEVEDVIELIRHAFRDASRENGVTLHEALIIDQYGSAAERSAARKLDTDHHWADVPEQLIEANDSVLHFLDAKGLRYYLPAYMVWSLRHFQTSESFSHNHPICSLHLSPSGRLRQWELDRFEVFNDEQARAICKFLRFMARQDEDIVFADEARQALHAHWGKFCDETARSTDAAVRTV